MKILLAISATFPNDAKNAEWMESNFSVCSMRNIWCPKTSHKRQLIMSCWSFADTHKPQKPLWQVLHPLPEPKIGKVKQMVFEEKISSDLWRAMHPIPETTRVPDHHLHIHRSSNSAGAASQSKNDHVCVVYLTESTTKNTQSSLGTIVILSFRWPICIVSIPCGMCVFVRDIICTHEMPGDDIKFVFAATMGGWHSCSGGGELWKAMHPVAGVSFQPRRQQWRRNRTLKSREKNDTYSVRIPDGFIDLCQDYPRIFATRPFSCGSIVIFPRQDTHVLRFPPVSLKDCRDRHAQVWAVALVSGCMQMPVFRVCVERIIWIVESLSGIRTVRQL